MQYDAATGTITGIWDDGDENTSNPDHHLHSKKLSDVMQDLCNEELYVNIHTTSFPL